MHRLTVSVLASALSAVCVLLASDEARAQDSHYWSQQFGPRASLLSGAVIGSSSDISGTFYNPGALALAERLPFAISADVFERETITLEDGAGSGVDLATSRSGIRPSLLAGSISTKVFGSDVLAYSVLTRSRASSSINAELIASGADIPPDLGLEELVGIAHIDDAFKDLWAGISYSHQLSSSFALGLTRYGAIRSQRRRTEGIQETIDTSGAPLVRIDIRGGNYNTLRTLAKVGGYLAAGPFSAGVTLTTPSLHITGSGQLELNAGEFSRDTIVLAANVQTDLPATYKSPLSIGFGLGYQLGKARINASGEWFDAIDPYVVLQGEDFVSQEPQEVLTPDVVQAVDDVFNWAVGLEYLFSGNTTGYASFATDKSGFTAEIERTDLSLASYDLQSVFAGVDFIVRNTRLTLGAGYRWGSSLARRVTELLGGDEGDFNAKYVYRSLRLLFGFELGLN